MISKKSIITIILLLITATITSACSLFTTTNKEVEGADITDKVSNLKIGMSMSAQDTPFLKDVQDIAKENAKDAKYKMVTADADHDADTQSADIEDMLAQDIDVLIINPVDSGEIVPAVKAANDADVPVVTLMKEANGGDVASHIVSNHASSGQKAAAYIAGQLNDTGAVVELRGAKDTPATKPLSKGFTKALSEQNGIDVIASESTTPEESKVTATIQNLIKSTDSIDGIFAHHDDLALKTRAVLETEGLEEEIIIVSYGGSEEARDAVKTGDLDATISREAKLLAGNAIVTARKAAKGDSVDDTIKVEVEVFDHE